MSRIRRSLVVAGLAVAVALGAALPAWAAFTDTAVARTEIKTAVIAPPTGIDDDIRCYDQPTWWGSQRRMSAVISWKASKSPDVTRYRVNATIPGQPPVTYETTDLYVHLDTYAMGRQPVPVTITALTGYGWSKAAPTVTVHTC